MKANLFPLAVLALTLAAAAPARATIFTETEPNDSKAAANIVANFTAGDRLTGFTTGSSNTTPGSASADYFNLNFAAPDTPGIYRQQVTLSTGFTGSLRGRTQTGGVINPGSDVSLQRTGSGSNFNQFYTFGDATSIFYRVAGDTTTTAPYTATLSTTPVTPTVVASAFQAGTLNISSRNRTTEDTDLWIYDANFRPIPGYGNDDTASGTLQSNLTAYFAPGTYYVAISTFNLANDQASPASDGSRSGGVTDAAGVLTNTGIQSNRNTSFTINDASGTSVAVPVTKVGQFDVNFVQFTVVPEPSTYAMMVGAGLLFLGIQRARRTA